MRTTQWVGIILIVLGILGFIFKGFSFTKKENVVDLGPIQVQHEKKESFPIPEVLSGIAIVGGIVLVIVGQKKKL
jgi:hypothetical protein